MRIAFVSANIFGLNVLRKTWKSLKPERIVTLSPMSSIKMYDDIYPESWFDFDSEILFVNRLSAHHLEGFDLVIIAGWRQVLGADILEKCGMIVGFHPTLLPFGRGPAPIINSILSGIKKSGVTLFKLDEGVDSGPIIDQEPFGISDSDVAFDVYSKAINAAVNITKRFSKAIHTGIKMRRQDESKAVYFKKPTEKGHPKKLVERAFSFPYGKNGK